MNEPLMNKSQISPNQTEPKSSNDTDALLSPDLIMAKAAAAEQELLDKREAFAASSPDSQQTPTTSIGVFSIQSANDVIKEAKAQPDPKPFWLSMWYEGEVCCLFSDSNLGKSILAVQIASMIAQKQKVLYFDFELSNKQFQLRYTDESTGELHRFPPYLYRVVIDSSTYDVENFEARIIADIETAATQMDAKVLIIDNLTYLCNSSEKGDMAGVLMMQLMRLKHTYSLSLLVLAHTPKRSLSNPITQNDLAGSKKLYNFFDSVFAIGKSASDGNLRYVKQIKVRYGQYEYDSDNVAVFEISKVGSFLQFVPHGCATERSHLRELSDKEDASLTDSIRQLHEQGMPYRAIAKQVGVSESKAYHIIQKL